MMQASNAALATTAERDVDIFGFYREEQRLAHAAQRLGASPAIATLLGVQSERPHHAEGSGSKGQTVVATGSRLPVDGQ